MKASQREQRKDDDVEGNKKGEEKKKTEFIKMTFMVFQFTLFDHPIEL